MSPIMVTIPEEIASWSDSTSVVIRVISRPTGWLWKKRVDRLCTWEKTLAQVV